MIKVHKEGVILQKTKLPFENEGVLNPGVIREGNMVHLFYRAVSKGNVSSIGYCKFHGPLNLIQRNTKPVLISEFEYESQGMEDPRLTKIDGVYFLSYTAFDGVNALGALATSLDLLHWEKQGLIVPQITFNEFLRLSNVNTTLRKRYQHSNKNYDTIVKQGKQKFIWSKNLLFFPRRINGKLCFLQRIKPDIQIIVSINNISDLTVEFWNNYFLHFEEYIVLASKYAHESSYIGGGCPPIETAEGWLIIYHGVQNSDEGFVYSACAALLDLTNPWKEISRLPYPLFAPDQEWELQGEVNNVCFPTGAVVFDDMLYIYYGAADERIACASLNFTSLIQELCSMKSINNVDAVS